MSDSILDAASDEPLGIPMDTMSVMLDEPDMNVDDPMNKKKCLTKRRISIVYMSVTAGIYVLCLILQIVGMVYITAAGTMSYIAVAIVGILIGVLVYGVVHGGLFWYVQRTRETSRDYLTQQ